MGYEMCIRDRAQARLAVCFKDDTITLHGLKHAEWFMDDYQGFASGEWMP